jgi:lipopolysaccharide biosynthesis regulator YciM
MIEVLLLALIPAAAWTGWILAKGTTSRGERKRNRIFSNRYFQGLNYLLDEQPDKAIAVFIEMAEVTSDTIETHLALGNLFRRRGEVERAIRVHQNIISKPGLDESQKTRALLELGEDYMRAGLFDRAENLSLNSSSVIHTLRPRYGIYWTSINRKKTGKKHCNRHKSLNR